MTSLVNLGSVLLVSLAWASGCFGPGSGHAISFLVQPHPSEKFVEFNDSEFHATPAMRFLERALVNATMGQEETAILDDDLDLPSGAIAAIRAKWEGKYGTDAPPETIVRYGSGTYLVLLFIQ